MCRLSWMKKEDVNTILSTDVSERADAQDLLMKSKAVSNIQGSLLNVWCDLFVNVNISVKRWAN